MTIGEFKELIDELELSDDLEIRVEYWGSECNLERRDCFKTKDYSEHTDKAIYLEI